MLSSASVGKEPNETKLEKLLSLALMVLSHDSQIALLLTQEGFISFKRWDVKNFKKN